MHASKRYMFAYEFKFWLQTQYQIKNMSFASYSQLDQTWTQGQKEHAKFKTNNNKAHTN